ncbi:hypothetical protein KP79_PYT24576 [Mizuhopecten yessoensis]|uniref:Uncharacterized protein n=1 Tax=Mizuhopecten yessoensis TaxID=6573 RepID=A0A210PG14_MIZYE|nr:hypothetical protein KP79_PYT24576 [Mizuhopecten yessoensis]
MELIPVRTGERAKMLMEMVHVIVHRVSQEMFATLLRAANQAPLILAMRRIPAVKKRKRNAGGRVKLLFQREKENIKINRGSNILQGSTVLQEIGTLQLEETVIMSIFNIFTICFSI